MKQDMKEFMAKVSEDEGLRVKLEALAGLPEDEVAARMAAIACEAGFEVAVEDLDPAETELDESELAAVSGGSVIVSPLFKCNYQQDNTLCCASCAYSRFSYPNLYCFLDKTKAAEACRSHAFAVQRKPSIERSAHERAIERLLKKASEDGPLKEELGALAGLPEEERAERAAAIAREAGFDVSVEDFAPVETELDDDELNVVAGGSYACCCRQTGTGLMDDRPVLCDCPREGTGAWTDGSGFVNVDRVCHSMGDVG